MLNSPASGRRLALRIAAMQLVAALLAAMACAPFGRRAALAALLMAGSVAVGTALAAMRTFAGVVGGGMALARLLSGMALKWITVIVGVIVIMVQWKLPPLAAITGLAAAYAVNLLAFRFKG